jgi:hypothetical protein
MLQCLETAYLLRGCLHASRARCLLQETHSLLAAAWGAAAWLLLVVHHHCSCAAG